jgi:hypothetical protein
MPRIANPVVRLLTPALLLAFAGCGDDDPSGPGFGDLEFPAGVPALGTDRVWVTTLTNVADVAIGPILIGSDAAGLGAEPPIEGVECVPMKPASVSPFTISSLAPGADVDIAVTFDLAGVTVDECPAGDYLMTIRASVNGRGLAAATVRLSFSGAG